MKRIVSLLIVIACSLSLFSQAVNQKKAGWHLLDSEKDGYMGISLDKAYEVLKGRKSTTIIVAVIDNGIDTLQEDLKSVLWVNEKEIPGNGIDDDGNGYTDDRHGWNFCGDKTGENLARNTYEIARVYHNWKAEFEGKKQSQVAPDKKFLYEQWVKAAAMIEKDYKDASEVLPGIEDFSNALEASSKTICNALSVKEF